MNTWKKTNFFTNFNLIDLNNKLKLEVQQVDIDIEECLEKYIQEQVLGDLSFLRAQERNFKQRKLYSNQYWVKAIKERNYTQNRQK